jgi:excisionase family DNA binding protein
MTGEPKESVSRSLYDVENATGYLRQLGASSVTVNFVRTLISTGQIPHLKMGKKFYVSKTALDAWISSHERRVR